MRFTAIDTSAWEELKESIVELTNCFNEHFAPQLNCPKYCTMGMCAEY